MDFYLEQKNCLERLVKEWRDYKKIVIAVDFDDTVYDFHKKGRTYEDVISLIRRCRAIGCYIIIFTANDDTEHHKFIREYLNEYYIHVDTINENIPCVPFKTKKPYYNILLDDRSGLLSAYTTLLEAVEIMEKEK